MVQKTIIGIEMDGVMYEFQNFYDKSLCIL